jgi:hypothetical protein
MGEGMYGGLGRLLPGSLFGRITLTFIGVLVLTMGITLFVQMLDREASVFRASAGPAARRVVDLVKLLDRLPQPQRVALAEIAEAQGVRIELFAAPLPIRTMTMRSRCSGCSRIGSDPIARWVSR